MFEPDVFRKHMYCTEESMWHCWDFSAPPAVIQRPGNFFPSPLVSTLVLSSAIMNKFIFQQINTTEAAVQSSAGKIAQFQAKMMHS